MHAYIHTHTHMHTYTHTYTTCIHKNIRTQHTHIHTNTHMHACIHTYMHPYTTQTGAGGRQVFLHSLAVYAHLHAHSVYIDRKNMSKWTSRYAFSSITPLPTKRRGRALSTRCSAASTKLDGLPSCPTLLLSLLSKPPV